jgi:hypothetical protein
VIFSEQPLLHTRHPFACTVDTSSAVDLAPDWQRLLALYAHLRRRGAQASAGDYPSPEVLELAMKELSAAGVTSAQSRAADPAREAEYREAARQWVKRYKETRKRKGAVKRKKGAKGDAGGVVSASSEWMPTVDEVERLIAILETNSHSRDEDDQQDLQDPRTDPVSLIHEGNVRVFIVLRL